MTDAIKILLNNVLYFYEYRRNIKLPLMLFGKHNKFTGGCAVIFLQDIALMKLYRSYCSINLLCYLFFRESGHDKKHDFPLFIG